MDSTYFILFKYAIGQIDDIDPQQWNLQGMGWILLNVSISGSYSLQKFNSQYRNDDIDG